MYKDLCYQICVLSTKGEREKKNTNHKLKHKNYPQRFENKTEPNITNRKKPIKNLILNLEQNQMFNFKYTLK